MKDSEIEELFHGVTIRFGLRQQGHLPTVKRMLAEGASWGDIGRAIGWDPQTAERCLELVDGK